MPLACPCDQEHKMKVINSRIRPLTMFTELPLLPSKSDNKYFMHSRSHRHFEGVATWSKLSKVSGEVRCITYVELSLCAECWLFRGVLINPKVDPNTLLSSAHKNTHLYLYRDGVCKRKSHMLRRLFCCLCCFEVFLTWLFSRKLVI